ncbi:MAG: YaaR family protein [Treponema sp.]|jgi:uncharacterized protein YaaR (DUF327 family)|nr:YaaR family protein [Treponema sp.]
MAKIDTSLFFNAGLLGGIKTETKKTKDSGPARESRKTRFSGLLERISQNAVSEAEALEALPYSEETVKALLDEVHSAGDDLKNRPLPEEIKRYKKAVKQFLHYVVKYGYDIKRETYRFRQQARSKTIVQVLDSKLEQLAAGILSGQTSQLEILRRLGEITGMLVDLLH